MRPSFSIPQKLSQVALCVLLLRFTSLAQVSQNTDPIIFNSRQSTTICNSSGEYLRGECYGTLAAAIASADCPPDGCTVDMSSPGASRALGVIAPTPRGKTLRVILGPFADYTLDHLVCTNGLEFMGRGMSTIVTSVGLNSQPVLTVPQVNSYNTGCRVHDAQLVGLAGNTSQEGFLFDVSTLTAASIQNSIFENLIFSGFRGSSIEVKGRSNDAASAFQGNTFHNIGISQPAGRVGPAVKITGYSAQNHYEDFFTVTPPVDSQDVVYIGPNGSTGTYCPMVSFFKNWSPQNGRVGIHIGCAVSITFDGGFSEGSATAFLITQDSSTVGAAGNVGITITNWNIAGTSGATAVITDNDSNSRVIFEKNVVNASGAFINGSSAANVGFCGNSGVNNALGCRLQKGVTFANLDKSPLPGEYVFCTDCKVTTAARCSTAKPASCVCAASGTGAWARYYNFQSNGSNWYCQ
jgi:hypothetical protein